MDIKEKEAKIARMEEIIKILEPAGRAYYKTGVELISNFEWDRLYDELLMLEEKTEIILGGSPTQKVGYDAVETLPVEKHSTPMLSLNKTKQVEDLEAKAGDEQCFLSWKMDGLTIVLTYEDGRLTKAVTRGNGEEGNVITQNAKYMKGVPLQIPEKNRKVIRGEATISYSTFKRVNAELPIGTEPFKNPRNLCAGTIRAYDPQIIASREVHFTAFDYVEGSHTNSHSEGLERLKEMGFGVVEGRIVTKDTIADAVKWFAEEIKKNDFPSDGLVLVYDDIAYGKSLGTTAKYPLSGLAYKWKDEEAETTIREIEWSVSRTSLINPVAIFDTVELEGSDVSRASVHNVSILKNMKLGIGDKVKVIKANMIIPQITANLTKSGPVEIPSVCPICGAPTRINIDNESSCETLYCTGDNCLATATARIDHFCSRSAMNIVGISEKTVEAFFEQGLLHSPVDIYSLEKARETITQMEGFGTKKYENLIDAINNSKHVELYRFLYAIGIPNFGVANTKAICKELKLQTIEDAMNLTKEMLITVDGVGEIMADSFVNFFSDESNKNYVNQLVEYITFKELEEDTSSNLSGMTFVITGTLNRMSRKELQALIEKNGGKVSGSVSSNTKALINNDATSKSSKNVTARNLGVKIMTEEEFFESYID